MVAAVKVGLVSIIKTPKILTIIGGGYNRFGQRFDKYKPDALRIRSQKIKSELRESEEVGRTNTQKNHSVGCCPR